MTLYAARALRFCNLMTVLYCYRHADILYGKKVAHRQHNDTKLSLKVT